MLHKNERHKTNNIVTINIKKWDLTPSWLAGIEVEIECLDCICLCYY